DVSSLVAADKLIDPKETAQLAAKGAVDKLPAALVQLARNHIFEGLAEWKKKAEADGPNALAAATAVESLVRRQWTAVEKEGDELGLKLRLDPKTAVLAQDYSVSGKAGTPLADDIKAWAKPKENRFTGLADKSAAAQGFVKLPFVVPELKDLAEAS